MKNQKQRILELLSDGNWHTNVELNHICYRYGGRIFELRKEGIEFEMRCVDSKSGLYEMRLTTPIEHIDLETCKLKPGHRFQLMPEGEPCITN